MAWSFLAFLLSACGVVQGAGRDGVANHRQCRSAWKTRARSQHHAPVGDDPLNLREMERRHVQDVLKQEKGNKVHAAKVLGISRRALYRLIHKYKLEEA